MAVEQAIFDEMRVLVLFPTESYQEGIKVHSGANADLISATERLHQKGFITQVDGGYLTDQGIEAANHARILFSALGA